VVAAASVHGTEKRGEGSGFSSQKREKKKKIELAFPACPGAGREKKNRGFLEAPGREGGGEKGEKTTSCGVLFLVIVRGGGGQPHAIPDGREGGEKSSPPTGALKPHQPLGQRKKGEGKTGQNFRHCKKKRKKKLIERKKTALPLR